VVGLKCATASLTPESGVRVQVQFEKIQIGPFRFSFNSSNYLDVTYLDNDLRISRGGRGNVFVLIKDNK
jgi:hypothetical protein